MRLATKIREKNRLLVPHRDFPLQIGAA